MTIDSITPGADAQLTRAVLTLLRELADGTVPEAAWVLNPGDQGLLRPLDSLSASAASTLVGDSSIAAHVDHLRYGLELMNRWSAGESPFGDADYAASWRRITVSDQEWKELRRRLRNEIEHWGAAVARPRDLTDADLTAVVGSVVHLAYHVGAIRQMNRVLRGPKARD
jgi:hypothetical protein